MVDRTGFGDTCSHAEGEERERASAEATAGREFGSAYRWQHYTHSCPSLSHP